MYTIKKGTEGIALLNWTDTDVNGTLKSKKHIATKELNFFGTITDPVYYHNNGGGYRGGAYPVLDGLAAAGYAVFASEDDSRYALAVKYDEVEVR